MSSVVAVAVTALAVCAAASALPSSAIAQDRVDRLDLAGLPTGCAAEPDMYPQPESSPKVQIWGAGTLPETWSAPPCAGWDLTKATTVILVLGSFVAADAGEISDRIAKVSSLTGLRYWSSTDQRWETLVLGATALDGPHGHPRPDFAPTDLMPGQNLFFRERDNRASGPVTYRMRILAHDADHVSLTIANTSPVKKLLLTFFAPGELQASYFITRLDRNRWGFMGLSGTRATGAAALGSADGSYVSRALAMYRHIAGRS